MGAGGNLSIAHRRAPHSKPPFSLSDIKKAIPPRCFRRSLLRSFSYVFADLAAILSLSYAAANYFHLLPAPLQYLAWPALWLAQGFFMVGYWVLAHECGHHAFSDYQVVDDVVGFLIHSSLLVPYFSWKISHRTHHANANVLERDESFVPALKSGIPWYYRYFNNPPGRVLFLLSSALFGWPMHLLFHVTGRSYGRWMCHFNPYAPMYTERERALIYLSDAGVLAAGYGLYRLSLAKGLEWLLLYYVAPMLVVHGTIVLIIYLHHTHPSLPRYDSSEWDWLRGGLATVDRDYGILNVVFHHIADTHVLHHLLPSIPHYHAEEATKAIKPVLGEYYQFDGTPILKGLWREVKECVYVEPAAGDEAGGLQAKGIFWFNNKGL
uniref:Delta13 fatty acid desaturase FADX-2 n=1 Tax=Exocarpos cupressiformis TaxID=795994 RepID=U5LP51_9MAGN|nr:delta13 fatty acid desaturase FADX-2 [Exocarpos cupressiformis]